MTFTPMSNSGKAPVRIGSLPEEAAGDMVSGNYFSGLGVGTELGRGFVEKDEQDHLQVTVISESFWSTHYQRSADVVGKALYIKSIPFTIVGIAKKGFEGTEGSLSLDFWIPLQSRPEFNTWGSSAESGMYLTDPLAWTQRLMVRTVPGVSREQALAQMQALFEQAAYIGLPAKKSGEETNQISLHEAKQFDGDGNGDFAKALKVLMTMVGLVLLIAMSNVVMLLMARNANRQREFGVRFALGAGRRTIARQLLTESMLLVSMGGAVAWAFALAATHALGSWARIESNLQPDIKVLGLTLGVLVLLAIVFGLAPLRSAMSNASQSSLRSSATVSQASSHKNARGQRGDYDPDRHVRGAAGRRGSALEDIAKPTAYTDGTKTRGAGGIRPSPTACAFEGRGNRILYRIAAEVAGDSGSTECFDGCEPAGLGMVEQSGRPAAGWTQSKWNRSGTDELPAEHSGGGLLSHDGRCDFGWQGFFRCRY